MSNKPRIFKKSQTLDECSERFDTPVIVDLIDAAADEPRMFYNPVTNEPFSLVGEKILNEITHFQLRNEITGDKLILTETAILERFSEKDVNTGQVAKSRMIRLSRMFQHS
ncbi:hypothetical protein OAJ39_09830 [Alphaproteobacteria bacterium]|nr:hypothetical protein [Alphaproteobacteria bacterium]